MIAARKFMIAFATAPDLKTARRLARLALESRLVACANLVLGLESHYWWQGKVESGKEVLLILKTSRRHLIALEELIVANHPYDTPEFVAWPLDRGSRRYLDWISANLRLVRAK